MSADPYVRRNIAALHAVEIAGNEGARLDPRIARALARRGLIWQGSPFAPDAWKLTSAGSRAIADHDANPAPKRRLHAWDVNGYAVKHRMCTRTGCGVRSDTFGVGAGRTWTYKDKDGNLLGTRAASCEGGDPDGTTR